MNGIKGMNKKNRKELVKALMKCGDEVDLSRFDGVSTK
jgi:thymidine phosphorylase